MNAPRPSLLQALRAAHVRLGLAAVVAAGVVLTLLSVLTLRAEVERNLTLVARSISYAAEAATVFGDAAAAHEVLAMVAEREGLQGAAIDSADGRHLAAYVRGPHDSVDEALAGLGTLLFPLQVTSPVLHEGRVHGQVSVSGNGGIYLLFLAHVLSAIALCTAGVVWLVARQARRFARDVVDPLESLAALTRKARSERAFHLRAQPAAVRELHQLGEDFNALLAEIESHRAELVAKHDTLKTANESLSFLAYHDALTGLPNRAGFLAQAARALALCQTQCARVALLYMDSDNFKAVNDLHGHAAGDELLVETARRIRAEARAGDVVARLGGDEFALLLAPLHSTDEARALAARIAAAIRRPLPQPALAGVNPSASIGVAIFPEHGLGIEQLLLAADAAMYRAKIQHTGSFEVFDAQVDNPARSVLA